MERLFFCPVFRGGSKLDQLKQPSKHIRMIQFLFRLQVSLFFSLFVVRVSDGRNITIIG